MPLSERDGACSRSICDSSLCERCVEFRSCNIDTPGLTAVYPVEWLRESFGEE